MSDVYLWETYDKLGREALDSGDLTQANEAFRSAVATAEEIQAFDRMVLSLRNLAATMMDMNQMSDAHELLVRTLEVANQNLTVDHSQTVETQRDLARICQQLGYLDKADELLKSVLEQELKSQETERIGSTLLSLAQVAQAQEEPATAAAYLQRVVKLKRQELGDDHPEVAQSLLWLSTALYQCGKNEDAQNFMRKAFGLIERQFADEPAHLAQSLLAGARMMVDSGQLEPALVHQKRALDIQTSILEPDDEKLWETREYIATTLAAMGKIEESIEILEFCFRNGNPQGARAGATYKNLAGLYLTLDKKEKAEELYEKASQVLESTLGIEHPAYLATQEERIQLYHFSGRTQEALQIALKTIRATEKRFGTGHPHTAQAYASTALLAHGVEDWETALELMRSAEKIWMSLSPRPEDVLANCRTNMATCLIKLRRFSEADPILQLAEGHANQALSTVIADLRNEMQEALKQNTQAPDQIAESPVDASTIDEPPRPSLSGPPDIVIEEPETDLFDPDVDIPDTEETDDLFSAEAEAQDEEWTAQGPPKQSAVLETTNSGPETAPQEESSAAYEIVIDFGEPESVGSEPANEGEEPDLSTPTSEEADPEEAERPEAVAVEAEIDEADDLFGPDVNQEVTDQTPEHEPVAAEAETDEADDLFAPDLDEEVTDQRPEHEPVAAEAETDQADDLFAPDVDEEVPDQTPEHEPVAAEAETDEADDLFGPDVDEEVPDREPVASEAEPDDQEADADDLFGPDVEEESLNEAEDHETLATESETKDAQEEEVATEADSSDLAPPEELPISEASEPDFVERRANPRSPLSFNRFFDLQVAAGPDATENLKSFLVDLGMGGIRVNSESPFPLDTDITLTLPDGVLGEEVELEAQVIWQKALYGASFIQGLAFKNLTAEKQTLIRAKLQPQGASRVNSRQHFRLYRPFPIKLQPAGQEEWQASYATDLSINGLGTRLRMPLEQGNPIKLRLQLEFELPTVEVEAQVAWSSSGENGVSHGLQFAEVGPVEARTIKRYIDRCLEFLPD